MFVRAVMNFLAAALLAAPVSAAPVQWNTGIGANQNYYELIVGRTTWSGARDSAAASTFRGRNGHLVTITSREEQTFIDSLNPGNLRTWIGATDSREEGVWEWITGETFDFSFWAPNEPNDYRSGEDVAMAFWRSDGRWNDCRNNNCNARAYIVEYNVAPVPLPPSVLLMGTAFGLLALLGWRRRSLRKMATTDPLTCGPANWKGLETA